MNHKKQQQARRAKERGQRRDKLRAKWDRAMARHWQAHDRAARTRRIRSIRAFSVVSATFNQIGRLERRDRAAFARYRIPAV